MSTTNAAAPLNINSTVSSTVTQDHELAYFAEPLPWHANVWQQLTQSFESDTHNISHALLAAGRQGIGKRQLVWRWVAWQLCDQKTAYGACGHCQSCLWLKAETHPDICILPQESSPTFDITADNHAAKKPKKTSKTASKTKKVKPRIKIDDIRGIQDFVSRGSQGMRICVFDNAETMTIGAANALLKTLEEPKQNVQLILITDNPSLLLPTINSRVQKIPLAKIDIVTATTYLKNHLTESRDTPSTIDNPSTTEQATADITQLLKLTGYAPLASLELSASKWYGMRTIWLKTWFALRNGSRTPVAAVDYWVDQLDLTDFMALTYVMLDDLQRIIVSFPTYQTDVDFSLINKNNLPSDDGLCDMLDCLNEITDSLKQNVQEKFAYDMLMSKLAHL